YFMSFFFYSAHHYSDLHSFPTRRSSDLFGSRPPLISSSVISRRFSIAISSTSVPDDAARPGQSTVDRGSPGGTCADTTWNSCTTDRKSTRLNSSHEWISYAVFCLKKKTI